MGGALDLRSRRHRIIDAAKQTDWPSVLSYIVAASIILAQIWLAVQLKSVYDCQTKYNVAVAEDRREFDKLLHALTSPDQAVRRQAFNDYTTFRDEHPLGDPKEFCA